MFPILSLLFSLFSVFPLNVCTFILVISFMMNLFYCAMIKVLYHTSFCAIPIWSDRHNMCLYCLKTKDSACTPRRPTYFAHLYICLHNANFVYNLGFLLSYTLIHTVLYIRGIFQAFFPLTGFCFHP